MRPEAQTDWKGTRCDDIEAVVSDVIKSILSTTVAASDRILLAYPEDAYSLTLDYVVDDLLAYASRDPSYGFDFELILQTSHFFRALFCYRTAHFLIGEEHTDGKQAAFELTEYGRVKCRVDIHPSATIGRRFILDHAFGTVIGETCEIGEDCYVLGGVILGARGIASNPEGKRHPTLGDRVQIGANARILGAVTVGSDTFISPNSIVTEDVPPASILNIVNQLQFTKLTDYDDRPVFVSGALVDDTTVTLLTSCKSRLDVSVVDTDLERVKNFSAKFLSRSGHVQQFIIEEESRTTKPLPDTLHLKIETAHSQEAIYLINPKGLAEAVRSFSVCN